MPEPIDKDTKLTPLKCTQCGAPLPRSGWTCDYCGTSYQKTPLDLSRYGTRKTAPDYDMPVTTTQSVCLTMSF